ncbi:MAG TPA: hypothetical protein VGR07_13040 [Thermoanaerobaculia bacterium]|jgi:hypothetical protein|nr:hypothetical protein [Thermoanaerobaculia bacterium]
MILLDTNVLIYASTDGSPFLDWARRTIASGVSEAPDFFIGAHAQVMGWPLVTADAGRFRTYFPSVPLLTPEGA